MDVDIMIDLDPRTAGPGLVQGQGNVTDSSMNRHSVTTSKMNEADVKSKAMLAQRNMAQGACTAHRRTGTGLCFSTLPLSVDCTQTRVSADILPGLFTRSA